MSANLQQSSQWWRWPLLPFASIFGAAAGGAAYALFWYFFSGAMTGSPFEHYVLPFIAGGTYGYLVPKISYKIAPAGKMASAISMTVIALVLQALYVASLLMEQQPDIPVIPYLLYAVASMIVGIYMLIDMYQNVPPHAVYQKPRLIEPSTARDEHASRLVTGHTAERFGDNEKSHTSLGQTKSESNDVSEGTRFRRDVEAIVREDYEYEVAAWQNATLIAICDDATEAGVMPGDAAAMFIETVCHALATPLTDGGRAEPLAEEEAAIVARMSLTVMATMNDGRASPQSFPRALRLLMLSKGATVDRLHEVDEILETFFNAAVEGRRSGIQGDTKSTFDRLLAMARDRGLIPGD
jgi:hypothetical protein